MLTIHSDVDSNLSTCIRIQLENDHCDQYGNKENSSGGYALVYRHKGTSSVEDICDIEMPLSKSETAGNVTDEFDNKTYTATSSPTLPDAPTLCSRRQ